MYRFGKYLVTIVRACFALPFTLKGVDSPTLHCNAMVFANACGAYSGRRIGWVLCFDG